jgi:hypothetical protein
LRTRLVIASFCVTLSLFTPAFADCEEDVVALNKALKSSTVTGEAKVKLEAVKKQAVDLAKAEKDKECHALVKDALKSVGIDL